MENTSVREKTTSDIVMQLLDDGSPLDLSSIDHIRLDMVDSFGKGYRYSSDDSPPYLAITVASTGTITFTPPDSTIFLYQRSPYKVYIQIFETASKSYSVPENTYSKIVVEREY